LPQLVPSEAVVHAVVLVADKQRWHALFGFAAPEATTVPPMKHPEVHVIALHTWAGPQLVPSASAPHVPVLVPG
jgi:hypothetical protein